MKPPIICRAATIVLAISFSGNLTLPAQSKPTAPGLSPAAVESIEKAVLETNARMLEAANHLNAEAFFEYIATTPKCVVIQNGTVFTSRQEAMQAVKAGFKAVEKMERRFEKPQVTVISNEAALLTSEGTVVATLLDGRVTNSRFAVSLLFVRQQGQWKLLHGHYSTPPRNQN